MIKDILVEMKLTTEQIDKIMSMIDSNYVQLSKFDEVNQELKKSKEEIKNRDKQLDELKSIDTEKLKDEIIKLQEDNRKASEQYEQQIKQLKIDNYVEKSLINSKAKNFKAVKALLELENAEIDDNGNVKGLNEQIEKLIKGKDTSFLFDNKENQQSFKGIKPAESDTNVKADISKMNYEQLCEYIENNPNAQLL